MTVKNESLSRVFSYSGMALPDPNPTMPLEDVKAFYANVYPELTLAEVDTPVKQGNQLVYEFRRAVGTKGSHTDQIDLVKSDLAAIATRSDIALEPANKEMQKCTNALQILHQTSREALPNSLLWLPSQALPVLA